MENLIVNSGSLKGWPRLATSFSILFWIGSQACYSQQTPYLEFDKLELDQLIEEFLVLERLEQETEKQIVRNRQLLEVSDSLQARLLRVSNEFERTVAIIDETAAELQQTQVGQEAKAKIRAKHQRWLIRYYNKLEYVHIDYHYPDPKDKWANRAFYFGSGLLFLKGVQPFFYTPNR